MLTKKYNEKEYEKYINFDAINVDSYKDIPYDYEGVMGVPETILGKYDLSQYEILGTSHTVPLLPLQKVEIFKNGKPTRKYKNGNELFAKYNPEKDTKEVLYRNIETNELYKSVYARLMIKRKKLEK